MSRYYFHVTGQIVFTDTQGVELADDSAAWVTAVASCGELLVDLGGKLEDGPGVDVTVICEGHVVAVVQVRSEGRPTAPTLVDDSV